MLDNIVLCAAFKNWEMTKMTYDSLVKNSEKPSASIFLDNGSKDGTEEWMGRLRDQLQAQRNVSTSILGKEEKSGTQWFIPGTIGSNLILAQSPENGGCGRGRNICLRIMDGMIESGAWAAPRYVTLIDNDIILTPGWDTEMVQFMDTHPQVGLCGPMTNWAGTPQLLSKKEWTIPGGEKDRDATEALIPEIETFAQDYKEKNRQKASGVPDGFIVIGFVMMIRWETYKQVGHFDDRYRLYGYEDTDYCNRVRKAGWKLAYFKGAYVHHWGSKSVPLLGDEFHKVWNENKAVYEKDWGRA